MSLGHTFWSGFADELTKIANPLLRKGISAGSALAKSGWKPQAAQATEMRKKVQALLQGGG